MELLTIKHNDFTMSVECNKFDAIWTKAKSNIGEQSLLSTYSWTEGVVSVVRETEAGKQEILQGEQAPAVFFDNADYPIWIEFEDRVKDAQFGSELQGENDKFSFRRGILAGFLNYGNEIGRSEINVIYKTKEGATHRFTFSFEVLSTKLDYHEHWRSIIEDIEAEYRMLSLDYMRRTFHGFAPDPNGDTPELIWWSVFAGEQEKFIRACKSIIDRPRHRLHGHESYKRADRLTIVPRTIENELAEHRKESGHLYRVEEQLQTNDTQENRFLKFALAQITGKYEALKHRIDGINTISEIKKQEMADTLKTLQHLGHNPFFRTVGRYKGMSQESMVLQKATGYSQVYRTWSLLHRGYSLYDGLYRLQTKDISTLYEIWCFIEVSHIVKDQLHLQDEDVEHRNRMEMNGVFTWELGKGEHSRILFKKDNVEMTYLFDAKYRIDGRQNGVDTPPNDAVNQMHRYRDAIYYKDYDSHALKKEVIGGYILFPGDGETADVEVSKFYKTIKKVNIGAFPLRPKNNHNRQLLEHFIEQLIQTKSHETIANVIPQKGAFVEVGNRVLIGLVGDNNRGRAAKDKFLYSTATLYYTGSKFPTTIALQDLHFFMPYIKGKGVRDVYEITRVRTISAKEAKQQEGEEGVNDIRLAFELRFVRRQYPCYQPIDTNKMAFNTFIDTTFDKLFGILLEQKI